MSGIQSWSKPRKHVIFSIDGEGSAFLENVFHNFLAENAIPFAPLVGCYKGETEKAYIVPRHEFDLHIRNSNFVTRQESFLYLGATISTDGARYTELYFQETGETEYVGALTCVGNVKPNCDAWSYRPDQNLFYTTRDPVGVFSIASVKARQAA